MGRSSLEVHEFTVTVKVDPEALREAAESMNPELYLSKVVHDMLLENRSSVIRSVVVFHERG